MSTRINNEETAAVDSTLEIADFIADRVPPESQILVAAVIALRASIYEVTDRLERIEREIAHLD